MVDVAQLINRVKETCRLMVGLPDYQTYADHARTHHPDQPVMPYEEFFKERQDRRYGGGRYANKRGVTRCC